LGAADLVEMAMQGPVYVLEWSIEHFILHFSEVRDSFRFALRFILLVNVVMRHVVLLYVAVNACAALR
jgi:hypothetical protein